MLDNLLQQNKSDCTQLEVGDICLCKLSLLLWKERKQKESKKFALGLSNGAGSACSSRTNSCGHLMFPTFTELDDDVPRHVWVSQLLLKIKSSPVTGEQGTTTVSCGEVKCRAHLLHLTETRGNVAGRRGRLITPTAEVWGWTKEISLSAWECDKECK